LIDGWFNYEKFYCDVIAPRLNENSIICEIGCWMGKSTVGMALANKKLNKKCKIYAIDTWEGSNEDVHKKIIKDLKDKNTSLYEIFLHNIETYGVEDVVFPIAKTSTEASINFKEKSVDLVIIDGSHEYNDVLNDIKAWIPKIKKGGMIIGDDYHPNWKGVMDAVNDYFGENNVALFDNIWYSLI
jgi:predicted O-methyltransferase YrrM